MGVRPDSLAGSWYPADPAALRNEVERCVDEAERLLAGIGLEEAGSPVATVLPHAGLAFSGGVAATGYLAVRRAYDVVDAFVVFGAAHRARLGSPGVWARGLWRTPLGDIGICEELTGALIEAGIGEDNEDAHLGDNAIELQTPFIKALFPEAGIVPVAMDFFPDAAGIGARACEAIRKTVPGKTVVAVASTDLTHYGRAFGVLPAGVGGKALDWAGKNDGRFLDALAGLDLDRIVPIARRDGSACGAGAAAAAAGWAKACGAARGVVLAYATSHDVMPSGTAEHFVGYGSVVYGRRSWISGGHP